MCHLQSNGQLKADLDGRFLIRTVVSDVFYYFFSFSLHLVLYCIVLYCVVYGMVWYGMVWYGMVWYGMVRYGTVR